MHVTKRNFDEVATSIETLLPTAAFVAIDEEMTGISLDEQSMLDFPGSSVAGKRYYTMRDVASRYSIIQFGLALFHERESPSDLPAESVKYEAHVFNFYLFPERGEVNMEVSAVAFNNEHGMD